MKIVAENLNEAIKHLAPKSNDEIDKAVEAGNFEPDQLLKHGVKSNNPKYILIALKSGKIEDNYSQEYRQIIPTFLKNDFEEGLNYLIKQDPENAEKILEDAATNNLNIDKWSAKLLPTISPVSKEKWHSFRNREHLYKALLWSIYYNHPRTVALFLKYKFCTANDIAEDLLENYITNWGLISKNPGEGTEIIKMAFTNYDISQLPQTNHKNPSYVSPKTKEERERWKRPETEKEYLHSPHIKKVKAAIKLMKIAKMDEKFIKPFTDELYKDTITVGRLIKMLQKYDVNDHIVINYIDDREDTFQAHNDYQHILKFNSVKDEAGNLLNIITTKYKN